MAKTSKLVLEETTKAAKPNFFAKAKGKVAADPVATSGKAETIWRLGVEDGEPTEKDLDDAVDQLHTLSAERKTIATKEEIFKGMLDNHAVGLYMNHLAAVGTPPVTPMKIVNSNHKSVTFVVQERCGTAKVTDAQVTQLQKLFGENDLVYEGGSFVFDEITMAETTPDGQLVQDVVAEAVSEALHNLVQANKLLPKQAEQLLTYDVQRRFKPNIIARVTSLCNKNYDKLSKALGILKGAVIHFVKP